MQLILPDGLDINALDAPAAFCVSASSAEDSSAPDAPLCNKQSRG